MELEDIAKAYIHVLAAGSAPDHMLDVDVSKKGGAPAQTAKRIILGRLIHSSQQRPLRRIKGDLFELLINGSRTEFRFAVTTARDAIPWFNVTEKELRFLQERRAVILVVWNASEPTHWCRRLIVFAIPPDALLRGYKTHRRGILRSLLLATLKKIEQDSSNAPGLLDAVRHIVDLTALDRVDATFGELARLRTGLKELIERQRESPLTTTSTVGRKDTLQKFKEKLFTLLLHIEQRPAGFVVAHSKTASDLFIPGLDFVTDIELTPIEAAELQGGYHQHSQGYSSEALEGIEDELADDSKGPQIIRPYDATKSKIDTRTATVDLLAKRIRADEIDLAPPFQRKGGLWNVKQKSQLIESLLIRIPLPAFYFDATTDARWLVVDGLQRLTTLKQFLLEEMELEGLEYLTQYQGSTFSALPRALQRIIEESQVTMHLIQPGTPPEVKFNIFRRINTGGLALTLQEIRHALNQGPVTKLLEELAHSQEFLEATTYSISPERMADRELVLRFLAFTVSDYLEYRLSDMDTFLSVEMGRLNKLAHRYHELKERFYRAMSVARAIFGNQAFRKMYFLHQNRSPINKALFEAWSVSFGEQSAENVETLKSRKDVVIDKFIALMNDDEFYRAISQGTQDVTKVRKRFDAVRALLQSVLTGATDDLFAQADEL